MVLPHVHLRIFHPIGLRIAGEAEKGVNSTPSVLPDLAQRGQKAPRITGEKDQRCIAVFNSQDPLGVLIRHCLGIFSTGVHSLSVCVL